MSLTKELSDGNLTLVGTMDKPKLLYYFQTCRNKPLL